MSVLSKEERKLKDEAENRLTSEYKRFCMYRWKQETELKKVKGLRQSSGVCTGMCNDWLRRKMLNEEMNPKAKKEPNFNDPKYAKGSHRQNLTILHGKFQHASDHLTGEKTPNRVLGAQSKLALVNGMDRLEYSNDEFLYGLLDGQQLVPHLKMKEKLLEYRGKAAQDLTKVEHQSVGILFSVAGGDKEPAGHRVAIHMRRYVLDFFDPNLGEYHFCHTAGDSWAEFPAKVCSDIYGKFYDWKNVKIGLMHLKRT